jgi:hypothetical protein
MGRANAGSEGADMIGEERHLARLVGLLTALALGSIGSPARAEAGSAWGDDAWRAEGNAGDDREAAWYGIDDWRQGSTSTRRRGRGLRIAGSIMLGVFYTGSVILAADTVRDGVSEAWAGLVPVVGPAIAAGTGHGAVGQHSREETQDDLEPEVCTEDASYCGLANGLVIELDGGLAETFWAAGNVIFTVAQVVGAVLLTAGHLLGARRRAGARRSWASAPAFAAF